MTGDCDPWEAGKSDAKDTAEETEKLQKVLARISSTEIGAIKQTRRQAAMQAEAILKLRTEITNSKNQYVKLIGEFLIQHLNKNPADAEKILVADKTIIKSLDEMKKEAKKKESGGVAMLADDEAYAIVLKYFGVESKPAGSDSDFDVNLDELLGV